MRRRATDVYTTTVPPRDIDRLAGHMTFRGQELDGALKIIGGGGADPLIECCRIKVADAMLLQEGGSFKDLVVIHIQKY